MPLPDTPSPFDARSGVVVPEADTPRDNTIWRDAAGVVYYGSTALGGAGGDGTLAPRKVRDGEVVTVPADRMLVVTGTVKIEGTLKLGNDAQVTSIRAGA